MFQLGVSLCNDLCKAGVEIAFGIIRIALHISNGYPIWQDDRYPSQETKKKGR